jgi:DNA-directed RNA polymerase subunit alpha
VLHEFSAIPGILEDVPEIVLNVKSIDLRMQGLGPKRMWLRASGPGEVHAGEIQTDDDIDILNPELVICTLDTGARIAMEMTVERGKGYLPAIQNQPDKAPIGQIPVDALFNPVRKVSYRVENIRVGQIADYDRLALRVETNGAIAPEEAVALGASILQDHLRLFTTFDESPPALDERKFDTRTEPVAAPRSADKVTDVFGELEAARMFGHEAVQLAAIELQRPLGVRQSASNRLRALHEIFGTTKSAF